MLRLLLVAACLFVYFLPFLRILTLPLDEGWALTGAARVVRGELPYRDFFEFVAPGTFYWIGIFFRILGENWLASRVCILVTGLTTALLVHYLARRLEPKSALPTLLVWIAASFPTWPTVNHHFVSNLFALAAFALVLHWLDGPRQMTILAAGILAGLVAATMIQKGGLLAVAILAALLLRRAAMRACAQFVAGFMSVAVLTAAYFQRRGGLDELIFANFVWPLENYSEAGAAPYGSGIGDYLQLHPGVIPAVLIALLPGLLLGAAYLRRNSAFDKWALPYWLAGSALWISEMHRPDLVHLVFGSPILLTLTSALAFRGVSKTSEYSARAVCVAGALVCGVNLTVALHAGVPIVTPIGSMLAFAPNPVLEFTSRHVRPGDTIFVYPYAPLYYFLSGARNPTRFSYLLYRHHTPDQMREVIASLERDRTRYVVWESDFETRTASWLLPSYRPPVAKARIIEPYLRNRYRQIASRNGMIFLERRD